jgi:hypothetical protein
MQLMRSNVEKLAAVCAEAFREGVYKQLKRAIIYTKLFFCCN